MLRQFARLFSVPPPDENRVRVLARWGDRILPIFVLVPICLLFVPVPAWIIDAAVSVHIASGVFVLLAAFTAATAAQLSSLPTLLLLSMLVRISIEISSVRHVLAGSSPGDFIERFGAFVVDGNALTGLVPFFLMALVQLIGVSKGLERVGEIGAVYLKDEVAQAHLRVTQALQAGQITPEEAERRHNDIEKHSSFQARMSGAAYFIKGDAVLSFVIIAISLLGGISAAVLRDGLSFGEAIETYSSLSIGTGLLSQLPCLLMSFAGGISLTRVMDRAEPAGLGFVLVREFVGSPSTLRLTAVALLLLAAIPGVPAVPFLAMSSACFGLPHWNVRAFSVEPSEQGTSTPTNINLPGIEIGPPAPIVLYLPPGLVSGSARSQLKELFNAMQRRIFEQLGVRVPEPTLTDSEHLVGGGFAIVVNGEIRHRGELRPGYLLVNERAPRVSEMLQVTATPAGISFVTGDYSWVQQCDQAKLGPLAKKTITLLEAAFLCLEGFLRHHVTEFLGIDDVRVLTEHLKRQFPSAVEDVVGVTTPAAVRITMPQLRELLVRLLEEGVSIRNLRSILEAVARDARSGQLLSTLGERVRRTMKNQICAGLANVDGTLRHYRFSEELLRIFGEPNDELLAKAQELSCMDPLSGQNKPLVIDDEDRIPLSPEQREMLFGALRGAIAYSTVRPVIIVPSSIRRKVWRVLRHEIADVAVLGEPFELPRMQVLKCKCIKTISAVAENVA